MAVKQVFNTSAELDFPNVLPTLDLDFANSKTLDPRITFTRSSGGSYVGADGLIKYAGVNEARFDHDPETGESLGLLIEEGRTNLALRSEEFDDAYWTKTTSYIIPNSIQCPDGTFTADTLVEDTSTSTHDLRRDHSVSGSTAYTYSIFAKKKDRSIIRLVFGSGAFGSNVTANYDLSLGTATVTLSGTNTSASIIRYPNEWYKCSLTSTTVVSPATAITLVRFMLPGGIIQSYTGDGTSGIYIWGAQLEQGAFPTSYIPTLGSTRTRAADNARIIGKNFSEFYNQSEGTLLIDTFKGVPNTTNGFSAALVTSQLNYIGLDYASSPNFCGPSYWRNNPTTPEVLTLSPGRVYPDNGGKYVVAYKINDFAATAVGGPVTEIRPTQPIPTATTLRFGGQSLNAFVRRKIHFRRVTYFPKRLPNSQLQALTS
jgi:hypothetical protein